VKGLAKEVMTMKVSTVSKKANTTKAASNNPTAVRRTARTRVHDLQHTVGNRTVDRLARSVLPGAPLEIQRKCADCEEEEKEL